MLPPLGSNRALVTGRTAGIGAATARRLAAGVASVLIRGRNDFVAFLPSPAAGFRNGANFRVDGVIAVRVSRREATSWS